MIILEEEISLQGELKVTTKVYSFNLRKNYSLFAVNAVPLQEAC